MKYRKLGNAGMKVSEVGLGGWLTFGKTVERDGVQKIVDAAVDEGINYFDLADVYAHGEAERVFGEALSAHRRASLVIASKAFWPMSDDINDRGLSRKHLFESIEGSLRRLGTDYLDIYFCHRHDPDTPIDEVVMAMDDLVRQGKVLYWGTSVWHPGHIADAAGTARRLGAHAPRAEQPKYNMLDRHIEPEILPTCREHGIGVVVWSPLAEGILTGKYNEEVPGDSRAGRDDRVRDQLEDVSREKLRALASLAEEADVTQAQLALAWCLRRPELSSVITGATRPEHVQSNAGASDVELDASTLDRIEEILGNEPAPSEG